MDYEIVIYEDYGDEAIVEHGPKLRFSSYRSAVEWLLEKGLNSEDRDWFDKITNLIRNYE